MEQAIIQIEADGRLFILHEAMLDRHSETWCSALGHDGGQYSEIGDNVCEECPHESSFSSHTIRGFVHWLYTQEIPSRQIVDDAECLQDLSSEVKLSVHQEMTTQLHCLGGHLGMEKLQDDATTQIFQGYRASDTIPSIQLLEACREWDDVILVDWFYVDLLNLRKAASRNLLRSGETLPESLLHMLCLTLLEDAVSKKIPEDTALRLRDRHFHKIDATYCACKRSSDDRYVISK